MYENNIKLARLFYELKNNCRYDTISSLLQGNENLVLQVNNQEIKNTALHIAVSKRSCQVQVVQLLLRCGANISAVNVHLKTPLHIACSLWSSNFEVIQELIACGASLHAQDNCGYTPLHEALNCCDIRVIKALIEGGSYVNQNDIHEIGMTYPLKVLLRRNKYSSSPVLYVLKLLLDQGAVYSRNIRSYSDILSHYILSGNFRLDIVKELISRGIAQLSDGFFNNSSWTGFSSTAHGFDSVADSYTILHELVSSNGYYDVLLYLLNSFKLNVNVQDSWRRTPLHLLMIQSDVDARAVDLFIKHGANLKSRDKQMQQPLHTALLCAAPPNINGLQILLDAGAPVSTLDGNKRSPLGIAVTHSQRNSQYDKIVKLLLKYAIKCTFKTCEEWQSKAFEIKLCTSLCADIDLGGYCEFYDFIKQCQLELIQMKACVLLRKFSLFDLIANSKKLIGNNVVRQVLELFIVKDFPNYRHCVVHSLPRPELYKVIYSLQIYSKFELGTKNESKVVLNSLCIDNILKHLNKKDLFNLCLVYYRPTNCNFMNGQKALKRQKLK